MNRERDNLTAEERGLLGDRSADELVAGERWLAERLGRAETVPPALQFRLEEMVHGELARQRRSRERAWRPSPAALAALAAMLLIAASLIVSTQWPEPRNPVVVGPPPIVQPAGTPATPTVAQARKAIDSYLDAVDEDVVQMHTELDLISQELSDPSDGTPDEWLVETFTEPLG